MADGKQRAFLDPGVLARLANVPLFARRPMQGNVSGRHQSPHRGSSVEFAEYRKYVPGDDTRRLDWRVYARTDRFYIKEFEADTNLRCHLVLDRSASMGFAHGGEAKIAFARRLAGTLAYLAVRQGDAVGLACCGESVVTDIPPRRNPAHLQVIFDGLEAAEPTGGTGLAGSLHAVAEKIPPRGLVVIFSDCFAEPEDLVASFQHLQFRKHDVVVFHLLDPAELAFGFDRPLRFVDMEDGTALVAEPSVIADRYHAALGGYLEELRQGCRGAGVDYRLVTTERDPEQVLGDFLGARRPRT